MRLKRRVFYRYRKRTSKNVRLFILTGVHATTERMYFRRISKQICDAVPHEFSNLTIQLSRKLQLFFISKNKKERKNKMNELSMAWQRVQARNNKYKELEELKQMLCDIVVALIFAGLSIVALVLSISSCFHTCCIC